MPKKSIPTPAAIPEIRSQAEAILKKRSHVAQTLNEADNQHVLEELQMHQIELELQNNELIRSRAEVETLLRQYTDLYDFAPVGYFTLGPGGEIWQANLAGATLLGQARAKLIKRRFGQYLARQSSQIFNSFLKTVFASPEKQTCEVALLINGAAVCVQIEASCSTAQTIECQAVVMDITERKRTEEKLVASEVRYRRLFETARDGVLILDAESGKIMDVNPYLINLLGYSHNMFLEKEIWEIGIFQDIAANKEKFIELKQYLRQLLA